MAYLPPIFPRKCKWYSPGLSELVDLGIILGSPSVIWSDSKSAVDMAFDPVAFKQTKHILRAAEFLRDLVAREVLTLRHVPGRVMIADLLTKAVARPILRELLELFDRYATDGAVCPSKPPTRASELEPATHADALATAMTAAWVRAMEAELARVRSSAPASSD